MIRNRWMWLAVIAILGVAIATAGVYAKEEGKQEGKGEVKAKVELSEAAAAALKAAFPNATIDEAKAEDEHGVKIFAVELKTGKDECDVEVTVDGIILSVATEVELKDVPEAVAKAIKAAAEGATIKEINKEEVRAEIKDKAVVKLNALKIVYEAELVKGEQKGEIEVAADGTVIEPLKWKAAEKEEKEEKGENKEEKK